MNGVHTCCYYVNILGENMKDKERQAFLIARKEIGELLMLSKLSPVYLEAPGLLLRLRGSFGLRMGPGPRRGPGLGSMGNL